jgi:ribonuclease HI
MRPTNKVAGPLLVEKETNRLTVFVDGAGSRPDGTGSGFAWICTTTNEKRIEQVSGLTNNQAEYRAFIAALTALPNDVCAEVFSDSQVLCCQFDGTYKVRDPDLEILLSQAQSLIEEKNLKVTLRWVPRARNLAGKLL